MTRLLLALFAIACRITSAIEFDKDISTVDDGRGKSFFGSTPLEAINNARRGM